MTDLLLSLWGTLVDTFDDVLPIVAILAFFQVLALRRPIPNLRQVAFGLLLVLVGLGFFLEGLERALFPLGRIMAEQLTAPELTGAGIGAGAAGAGPDWRSYGWVYLFGFAMGFSSAVAEPALIAVALKAHQVSGGTIGVRALRVAVAIGVGSGIAIGTLRIVAGIPLPYIIVPGYALVLIQTRFAPRAIVPLAYDSGGVSTSTVTVPLVTALGLGLSGQIPGRDPLTDGFGLIACACLFPIATVMGYAQLTDWTRRRARRRALPPGD